MAQTPLEYLTPIDLGENNIVNLADPVNLQDAATRNFVLNIVSAASAAAVAAATATVGYCGYEFIQGAPANLWVINHDLNRYPDVIIVDSAGTFIIGEPNYINLNQLTVAFSASFSGTAYVV